MAISFRQVSALGVAFVLWQAAAGFAAGRLTQQPVFLPPPRLAVSSGELALTRSSPGFRAVRAAAIAQGKALLAKPVIVPKQSASWIFYYACTDDGTVLTPLSLERHQCPRCKKIYTDERTVAAYRYRLHSAVDAAILSLGWAYIYSGDERFAVEGKRLLTQLAADYPNYPARLDRWGRTGKDAVLGGRRYIQSLDEAYSVISVAKGYDLLRTAKTWTDAERKFVEDGYFRGTEATLLVGNQGINNHQTWYNAGLMSIANVLGDAALVEKVLNMDGGFYYQLEGSIGSDGLWYEGTMAYHGYAALAMTSLADITRKMGLHLELEPKFRKLFTGPLHAAYPNGQFPVINDSDAGDIHMLDSNFQWAWNTYRNPVFAQALAWGNPSKLTSLLGPGAVPVSPLSNQSEVLPDAGLAILRQGSGADAVCAFVDFGQHGGDGHGHFDKLNLMLYANGREWLLDPGRLTYSHKEYKTWVKQTAAHNSVTIGGQNQQANAGSLLYLQQGEGYAACATVSNKSYFDSTLKRYLLLTPKMLVDIYDVKTPLESQIDWFAHAIVPALQPVDDLGPAQNTAPGEENGYQHLTDAKMWMTQTASRWDFISDTKKRDAPRLRLWLADEGAQQIFSTTGIGYTVDQKAPCLIRRRTAEITRFVTVYDLSGKGSYISNVTNVPGDAARVKVATVDGEWDVEFGDSGVKASLKK